MKVKIPLLAKNIGGPSVTTEEGFTVLGSREGAVIIEFHERPAGVEWFEEFEILYCREQHEPETIKVIRAATDEERKVFRIPVWVQDEEVPECCGKPMQFVGQIDDDAICNERPAKAKMWWHDAVSFYVFTCSLCLEVKAVGQQC